MSLKESHENFCQAYVFGEEVGSGIAAARAAFPKQTNGALSTTAWRLLRNAEIVRRIDELFADKRKRQRLDSDAWDREAAGAAFTNIDDVMDWDEKTVTLKPKSKINPLHMPAIQSITIERSALGITKTRVTLQSKDRMLNLCALRLGLYRQLTPTGELWTGGTFHRGGEPDGDKEKDSKGKAGRSTKASPRADQTRTQASPRPSDSGRKTGRRRPQGKKVTRSKASRGASRRRR